MGAQRYVKYAGRMCKRGDYCTRTKSWRVRTDSSIEFEPMNWQHRLRDVQTHPQRAVRETSELANPEMQETNYYWGVLTSSLSTPLSSATRVDLLYRR